MLQKLRETVKKWKDGREGKVKMETEKNISRGWIAWALTSMN